MVAIFDMPRLPAPIATREPGFRREPNPLSARTRRVSLATSGRPRRTNFCRTGISMKLAAPSLDRLKVVEALFQTVQRIARRLVLFHEIVLNARRSSRLQNRREIQRA